MSNEVRLDTVKWNHKTRKQLKDDLVGLVEQNVLEGTGEFKKIQSRSQKKILNQWLRLMEWMTLGELYLEKRSQFTASVLFSRSTSFNIEDGICFKLLRKHSQTSWHNRVRVSSVVSVLSRECFSQWDLLLTCKSLFCVSFRSTNIMRLFFVLLVFLDHVVAQAPSKFSFVVAFAGIVASSGAYFI